MSVQKIAESKSLIWPDRIGVLYGEITPFRGNTMALKNIRIEQFEYDEELGIKISLDHNLTVGHRKGAKQVKPFTHANRGFKFDLHKLSITLNRSYIFEVTREEMEKLIENM